MWIHLDETLTDKSLILLLLSSVNPLPATVPILPAWLRKQMHTGMIGTLDATISFWKKGESERESILNTLFIHTIRNIYNKMFNLVLLESLPMTEVATGAARHLVKGGSCHPLPPYQTIDGHTYWAPHSLDSTNTKIRSDPSRAIMIWRLLFHAQANHHQFVLSPTCSHSLLADPSASSE